MGKVQEWSSAAKPAAKTNTNEGVPPRPLVSKLATLQERLDARLTDLQVTDSIGELVIKPNRFLGDAWKEVNEVVRSLGGKWQKG